MKTNSPKSGYLRVTYFIRSYKREIITTIIAIISLFLSDIVYFQLHPFNLYVSVGGISIIIISVLDILKVLIIIVSLFIILSLRIKSKDFYFISLTRKKDKNGWLGQGVFDYEKADDCFSIANSESGYIYSKCLTYSNYEISFDFKIKSYLGVIVRAKDLSNCIVLQIQETTIEPYIKINGMLRNSGDPNSDEWQNFRKITFTKKLVLDKWYRCILSCEKESVTIKLTEAEDSIVLNHTWRIPNGNVLFRFPSVPEATPFSINLEYGSIGFCNSKKDEKAFVKNILIQNI